MVPSEKGSTSTWYWKLLLRRKHDYTHINVTVFDHTSDTVIQLLHRLGGVFCQSGQFYFARVGTFILPDWALYLTQSALLLCQSGHIYSARVGTFTLPEWALLLCQSGHFYSARVGTWCLLQLFQAKSSEEMETSTSVGLVRGHAYGITAVKSVPLEGTGIFGMFNRDTMPMIRLRNPWGQGEWKGAFSDGWVPRL